MTVSNAMYYAMLQVMEAVKVLRSEYLPMFNSQVQSALTALVATPVPMLWPHTISLSEAAILPLSLSQPMANLASSTILFSASEVSSESPKPR